MKSLNFEILRDNWPELADVGRFVESYAYADTATALIKLRLVRRKPIEGHLQII